MTEMSFDTQARLAVLNYFIASGAAPKSDELAQQLSRPVADVRQALARLAAGRALVLQEDGEVLMAAPFSAVPTAFQVTCDGSSWYANCSWDALGVFALLEKDGRIHTSCGCCGFAMTAQVRGGALRAPSGVTHFPIPARRWWDNIVFN